MRAVQSSDLKPYSKAVWRLVESQHQFATMKLVDTVEEQELLEDILEETKPTVPQECQHLHYLLSTPFRYGSPYPHGSRFRRAGRTLGVYYAAEHIETALAELVFYRLLFFQESPATPYPDNAAEFTGFAVTVETQVAVDLTVPPFSAERAKWLDLMSYNACQSLADTAREHGAELIRYQSVRDPEARANVAVLTCNAFADPGPTQAQSWRIRIQQGGAQAVCDGPRKRMDFPIQLFANDPRIARKIEEAQS
ncbi:RES family NAD+ phosphorylase [Pseudovibrio exalbescens]|uniref:RES family NAD+ phosphorylase n=1 Tax=Pseudovibrio exalbescens TaxID=197461 RepID=UPI003CC7F8AD